MEGAVRRALDERIDLDVGKNALAQNEVNQRFLRNQVLPGYQCAGELRRHSRRRIDC